MNEASGVLAKPRCNEMNAADDCGPARYGALNSFSRRFDHVGRDREIEVSVTGFGDESLRDDVLGSLIERGSDAEEIVR